MRRRHLVLGSLSVLLLLSAERGGGEVETPAFDFRYEVLPILHRQQCASAYCHGAATGRGGFRLSLFASDPEADYLAITSEFGGRRIDLLEPHSSLLLKKPTRQVEHGGGRRLRRDDVAYAALHDWIANGAPRRSGAGVELAGLAVARNGDRLQVTATFDGEAGAITRDVTALSTFSSSDERVAEVGADGVVRELAAGEAWLFARYVNQTARVSLVRPFGPEQSTGAAPAAGAHALDSVWLERLAALGLQAAPRATAGQLARRLYLDLADRVPTPKELAAFVARDDVTAAVAETADQLMRSQAFAEKFGRHLAAWFEIPAANTELPAPQAAVFASERDQLVQEVARGVSLHDIVRRVLVEAPRLFDRLADPRDRAELCGRAVLGVRIGCARCHDSPTDSWQRGDHLAFSALFASARPGSDGRMQAGVLFDPDTREPVQPKPLPVSSTSPPPQGGHRQQLAWFVLESGNGLFERNFANRVFAALLGRGLVEPLDDHRDGNPAVHEPVLALLADCARSGDLRALVRVIVTSSLYQATSVEGDPGVHRYFARREARALDDATFTRAFATLLGTEPSLLPAAASPLAQELRLRNGELLHTAVDGSPVLAAIARGPAEQRLEAVFATILSRSPSEHEQAAFAEALAIEDQAAADLAVKDLAYALLASREFASLR